MIDPVSSGNPVTVDGPRCLPARQHADGDVLGADPGVVFALRRLATASLANMLRSYDCTKMLHCFSEKRTRPTCPLTEAGAADLAATRGGTTGNELACGARTRCSRKFDLTRLKEPNNYLTDKELTSLWSWTMRKFRPF